MKNGSQTYISMLLCTLIYSSCIKPPCECDFVPVQFVEGKVINQQGQNLIFGSTAQFRFDSVRLLATYNSADYHNASIIRGLIDSAALRFDFYVPAEKSYIYYNRQTALDSLEIKWQTKTGKCCGAPHEYRVVE